MVRQYPNNPCKPFNIVLILGVCFLLLGTTPKTPSLDAEMAERAISGAEWLASHASPRSETPAGPPLTGAVIEWLLDASDDAAFADYLITLGYPRELAIYQFLGELPLVLFAYEASTTRDVRDINRIREDIATSPTVPLNAEDEQRLAALRHELDLASVPEPAKEVVSVYSARIGRLLEAYRSGGLP